MGRLTDTQMATLSSRFPDFNPPLNLVKKHRIADSEFVRDAWDDAIYYSPVVQDSDGTHRMLYTAYPNATTSGPAIATSIDLINWTKPIIGDVVHEIADGGDGTSNNNLIVVMDKVEGVDLSFYDDVYIALLKDNAELNAKIYTSTDGENFTYLSTPFTVSDHGTPLEAKSLLKIDGVYRIYCRSGTFLTRSIGYYESSTLTGTIADGSWVWSGLILTAPDQDNQYYDFQTWEYGGIVWGCCPRYNKTTEVLGPLELYGSVDGGKNFSFQGNIIDNGASGRWDDELTAVGRPMLIDSEWNMMYSGSSEGHDIWIRPMSFGLASDGFPQLVTNGSFEFGVADWTPGIGDTLSKELTIVHAGSLSMKITAGTSGAASQGITTVIGQLYAIEGYLYLDSSADTGSLYAGTSAFSPNIWTDSTTTKGSWIKLSGTFEAVGTTTYIGIFVLNDSGDIIYVDDISVIQTT